MPEFPEYLDPELRPDYTRDVFVFDVYDGDTVYYHADLGYGSWAAFQTGRLLDCWAPEIRPLRSREAGTAARDYLCELICRYALNRHDADTQKLGHKLVIRSARATNKWFEHLPRDRKGKYGRWLVTLLGADDDGRIVNLNELMVQAGHATACS